METQVIVQARKLLESYTKWLVDRADLPQEAFVYGYVDLYLNQTDQSKIGGVISDEEAIKMRRTIRELFDVDLLTKEEYYRKLNEIRARMGMPPIKIGY